MVVHVYWRVRLASQLSLQLVKLVKLPAAVWQYLTMVLVITVMVEPSDSELDA